MRRSIAGPVALCMLIAATLHGDQGQARAKPKRDPETAVIAGRVIDAGTGRPIDGAVVTATGRREYRPAFMPAPRPSRVSVMTRADGRFTFRNLMAGAYGFEVARPGYIGGAYGQRRPAGSSRQVEVEPGEQAGITIALWRFAAITGTILDEVGEPVVGQEVRALRRVVAGGRMHLRGGGGNWTDDRGIYRIGTLPPGTYVVVPVVTQRAAPASATEASSAPEGTVMVPIGSALHIIDVDSPVPPLLPGSDRLLIYPMQFYPGVPTVAQAAPIVIGSGEERVNVDFQFLPIPALRVSGRVLEAPPGSQVTLRLFAAGSSEVSDAPVAVALGDANGQFTFPAVPPGDYLVRARSSTAEDNRWAVAGFSVGQRDVTNLDLLLRPGLRIAGRVEFHGSLQTLLRGMHVAVEAGDGGELDVPPVAVTQAGRFTIDRLPAGSYVLRTGNVPDSWMVRSITHDGRDVTDAPLALSDDAHVIITLTNRVTELHGTARSAAGTADPDALVVLFPADRDVWRDASRASLRVRHVRPDRNGTFRVVGVPPGDYHVVAVPAEEVDDGDEPVFAELARRAELVRLDEGTRKDVNLQTRARR